ncbi:DUF1802 family protein [Gorillibacterium sp. CAU 1737]|uniref:DUF1802 family protein n=1 Tax=Gorillibacterium sp. CAU 1737 TaxID=3140362 RepID=UPI0032618D03
MDHHEPVVALKEWAVTLEAMGEGNQILLLRKGGIREETRDFALKSSSFYLFPTYEHQKEALIKDAYKPLLADTMTKAEDEAGYVTLTYWAEVVQDLELTDEHQVAKLQDLHLWTATYVYERFHWKPTRPLHLLLLRVYRLDEPLRLPLLARYSGCKSWIAWDATSDTDGMDFSPQRVTPVLDEDAFQQAIKAVHSALELK